MYKILIFLSLATILSCKVAPEPLQYGKDGCHTCKMTLVDKKFGGEFVTKKGKIYKFDDMNCMIDFYNSGNEPVENIAHCLVVDFANAEKLIDAKQAFYTQSDQIKSPMASHIAAFEVYETLETYNVTWNGVVLSWQELLGR